ncbi:hypothetical protein GRI44_02375 [Altererythrobacter confluentis]|uniref:Uncharacterized protein n=1 Tax=Allopontixanthobacter confluentis TaxID=1849021 RepID=A0A6L7GDD4_9SPHN|nr:hypothetical protein [Allopontixanthobacter confluentis]MXP13600.1 hypothetical protein [Allopontixanthobacter confluentis]
MEDPGSVPPCIQHPFPQKTIYFWVELLNAAISEAEWFADWPILDRQVIEAAITTHAENILRRDCE